MPKKKARGKRPTKPSAINNHPGLSGRMGGERQKPGKPSPSRPSGGSRDGRGTGGPWRRGPRPDEQDRAPQKRVTFAPNEIERARVETQRAVAEWLEASRQLQETRGKAPPASDDPTLSLDPWQREAYDALVEGANVIVDAPTTAGKTRVVETYFRQNFERPDFRAAYTTPVKSLSNDKLREFREMFGAANVGIATGDIKENLNAPIVVATLESYRNSLLGVEPDLGRSLVVFDEYHFLQDFGRGSAWEEAIILTPPSCQVLLLSASVANPEDFSAWLEKLSRRPARVVTTLERPVPLANLVWVDGEWLMADALPIPSGDPARMKQPVEPDDIARRVKSLVGLGLTPCIIYAGRRLATETLAALVAKELGPLDPSGSDVIRRALESEDQRIGGMRFLPQSLRRMIIVHGVGYHHSGLPPGARLLVEALVKNGVLRFVAATMGLSIGINFSVRSALISDYSRPGEAGLTDYPASEVLQMLGRAGRRGRDAVGFSLWPSVESFQKFGRATRERCESRLRIDPTTFLGLIGRGHKLRDIEQFYEKSFLRYGNRQTNLHLVRRERLEEKFAARDIPCSSPAHEYSRYRADRHALCGECPLAAPCHRLLEGRLTNRLSRLHLHLHMLGCLDSDDQLTRFGAIARYFPQPGGLVIAHKIDRGELTEANLLATAELMASFSLARFKEPGVGRRYRFPFPVDEIEKTVMDFYPYGLFPEVYDPPFGRRTEPLLRDFNPAAGYAISEWLRGTSWTELVQQVTTEQFAQGDLMAIFYRTASYLQSLVSAKIEGLSSAAASLRRELLRDPLTIDLE